MPLYEYEPDCGQCIICSDRFQRLQKRTDPPLDTCPICEKPCHRVISASNVASTTLSDGNVRDQGFAKYQKTDDGTYEKVSGHGPDLLDR